MWSVEHFESLYGGIDAIHTAFYEEYSLGTLARLVMCRYARKYRRFTGILRTVARTHASISCKRSVDLTRTVRLYSIHIRDPIWYRDSRHYRSWYVRHVVGWYGNGAAHTGVSMAEYSNRVRLWISKLIDADPILVMRCWHGTQVRRRVDNKDTKKQFIDYVHRILITGLRLDFEVKEICTNWCGEDFRVTSLTSKHRLIQKIRFSIFLFRHVTNETRWRKQWRRCSISWITFRLFCVTRLQIKGLKTWLRAFTVRKVERKAWSDVRVIRPYTWRSRDLPASVWYNDDTRAKTFEIEDVILPSYRTPIGKPREYKSFAERGSWDTDARTHCTKQCGTHRTPDPDGGRRPQR
jgi:hypothetical protein